MRPWKVFARGPEQQHGSWACPRTSRFTPLLLAGTVGVHILQNGVVQLRLVFDKCGLAPVVLDAPSNVHAENCGDSSELHQLTGSRVQVTGKPCIQHGQHSTLQHLCVTRARCIDKAVVAASAGDADSSTHPFSKRASRRLKQAARTPLPG
jgi:hypothetical protein